jgi:hypothetical protein
MAFYLTCFLKIVCILCCYGCFNYFSSSYRNFADVMVCGPYVWNVNSLSIHNMINL